MFGNTRENTSRNCSSFNPACRISFSLALPTRKKFFVRILTQLSFAATALCCETTPKTQRVTARGKTKRFIKMAHGSRENEGSRDGPDYRDGPVHFATHACPPRHSGNCCR